MHDKVKQGWGSATSSFALRAAMAATYIIKVGRRDIGRKNLHFPIEGTEQSHRAHAF